MNHPATSQEAILTECRRLVMEKGPGAINMREVAAACGVALGSLYNYFPSKGALIAATVESVWHDIFYAEGEAPRFDSFIDAVRWFHEGLARSQVSYPGFFTLHAMSFAVPDKEAGRDIMRQHFERIQQRLREALAQDPQVRQVALNETLSPQGVVRLVFGSVLALALQGGGEVETLLALLRRALYKAEDRG